MTATDLHEWATRQLTATDPVLVEVGRAVLGVIRERAELRTPDYLTLREDLKIARYALANYEREHARLRGLLYKEPSPWEAPAREVEPTSCPITGPPVPRHAADSEVSDAPRGQS